MILCYHRVAQGSDDPFLLCVSPRNFASHLDQIARLGEPSPLSDIGLPSRRPRVAVTFDDGYADNLLNMLPIAEAKGIPVTVFVTSGVIGDERGFWWDRLAALLRARPDHVREVNLVTTAGEARIEFDESNPDAMRSSMFDHLQPLLVEEVHRVLDLLAEEWGVESLSTPETRPLTQPELVQLASSDAVTIGAHTVEHARLADLSADQQLDSISSSKAKLEELIGRPVTQFAYPFGGPDSFNDDTLDAVRSSGFDVACTTIKGNSRPTSNPHLLPRRMVMNWSPSRFRVSFERWRLVTNR
jgi:peptidoglycan/xylan/chitin deacetylase (PgdA/CDA1 family)